MSTQPYLDIVFVAHSPDFLLNFDLFVGELLLVDESDDAAGACVYDPLDGLPRPRLSHHNKVAIHANQPGLEVGHALQDEAGAVSASLGQVEVPGSSLKK